MGVSSVHFSPRRWECCQPSLLRLVVVTPCMSSRTTTQKFRTRASPLLSKMADDDLYTVLDVKKTASAKEIKKAYRRMAIRLHPDVNPGPELREKFEKIMEAYKVLGDDNRRAVYDNSQRMRWSGYEDFGRKSIWRGHGKPNARVRYDQAKRKAGTTWKEANPIEDNIDDSFGRILGDFMSGIGNLGRSGFSGGQKLLESIIELMENEAVDEFMKNDGINLDDVLRVGGGREELRQAAKDMKLFSRKLKRKVIEVGETTLATEKELDELRQIMKAGKKRGKTDGSACWSISDVEREVELVEKSVGLRARYESLKKYLNSIEQFRSRLEKKVQQIIDNDNKNNSSPIGEQQYCSQMRYTDQHKMPLWGIRERELKNSSPHASPHASTKGLHTERDKHEECFTINEELTKLKKEMQRQGRKE